MEFRRKEFEDTVLPHLDAAYTLARYLVRDEADAHDVVQESFLRAIRHFDKYRGENARAWLLSIVRNCCATLRARDQLSQKQLEFDESVHSEAQEQATADHFLIRADTADAIQRAVESLSPESREVLVLREVQELSYEDIAVALSVPIGTVMSRLSRARKRLQKLLGEDIRDAG